MDIRPDPRISNERPAWLADDQQWREQLEAMELDGDIRWVEQHWRMAGGAKPSVDVSWVKRESTQPDVAGWVWLTGLAAIFALAIVMAIVGARLMT